MYKKTEVEIGGRNMVFETGKMAKQADGSVLVSCGDTMVLVTVVAEKREKEDMGFMPLTIEYQERLYAAGRIPGNYFRREIGRPSEKEILTSRLIDRPLRPLFPKGYRAETQLIATVFSAEQEIDPDILAMNGASAALMLSDIPWNGPVAAAKVGYIDGQYVLNPSKSQLAQSAMNLVVACSEAAVIMVEGRTAELSEEVVLDAIFFAHQELQSLIATQKQLQAEAGKPKRTVTPPVVNEALKSKVEELAAAGIEAVVATAEKMERSSRYDALKAEVLAGIEPELYKKEDEVADMLDAYRKKIMRDRIVNQGIRLDGRRHDQVRPITCEVGVLPKAHGSALFTRGETQALVVATLGSERDELHIEGLTGDVYRRFMLHYNFQPFCVGEVRALRGPSRRDIGHGTLARRGIEAVLPDPAHFPYTMRVTSEVLESNGSSSMATVCGGSLALMDAGVPIKAPVSGVAMGLIKEGDKIVVLTDILGDEDHLGDMDFKVVGTASGIASLQMDIKIDGVSRDIMGNALAQAKEGRLHILGKMEEALGIPRTEISDHAPRYVTMKISQDKIRDIIGPGGKIIRELTAEFDAKIDVDDDGTIKIFSKTNESAAALIARIEGMTAMPEVGRVYDGLVKTIKDFGAFVEILPGTDGMVHISELAVQRVNKVEDVLKEGDRIKVKVLDVDSRGRIRLSRKAVLEEGKA
ncbi:polyribonucleotide nucleotidyltransferase [Candidatus Electronema sp. PJ]|uniref:polyribonucleotide nucleotidyltransferase n=1 Tax=Candidatus Electronema sp. PJ TaxID=3401572 RepID=UPI003AA94879